MTDKTVEQVQAEAEATLAKIAKVDAELNASSLEIEAKIETLVAEQAKIVARQDVLAGQRAAVWFAKKEPRAVQQLLAAGVPSEEQVGSSSVS
jgi:hypothetical protein